ncbi:hyaluronidase-like [Penaeus japonicus]|uniref:hyaluronidase-like n=1 Tax=Penaeus japonicus TaxID=27405 RepID=UPI001C70DFED|nr:hyaluronidase-like [Penaeus japonicus]
MSLCSSSCPYALWAWVCVCVWALACPSNALFTVYWNSPTEACHQFGIYINVSAYGIVQNTGDKFYGDKVTIFYGPGAFPVFKGNTAVNGGIPQRGNLSLHVDTFVEEVRGQMEPDFEGVAILDFETYYPNFYMSPAQYRQASISWVAARHPDWPAQLIAQTAERTFNDSAREFFQVLLWAGRELRPKAQWGYYHYPYCHNYGPGVGDCKPTVMQSNDKTMWLFEGSSALYPSIYIFKNSGWDPRTRRLNTEGRLREALRVRRNSGKNIPIYPYFWYKYHDSPSFLIPIDVVNTLGYSRMVGLEGAVIWGSKRDVDTKEKCLAMKSYVETGLGPLVQYISNLPLSTITSVINSRRSLKKLASTALRESRLRRKASFEP